VLVSAAFVRTVTHPRFSKKPATLEEAFGFVEAVASAQNTRLLGASASNWPLLRDLCRATKTRGARIADVQHAAVAIEHGGTLVSRDPDFRRFEPHGLDFELLEL
jgi:uncharacterized protein